MEEYMKEAIEEDGYISSYPRSPKNYFFNTDTNEILEYDTKVSQKMWEEKYNSSDILMSGTSIYNYVFIGYGIGMNYNYEGKLSQHYGDIKENMRFYKFVKK